MKHRKLSLVELVQEVLDVCNLHFVERCYRLEPFSSEE